MNHVRKLAEQVIASAYAQYGVCELSCDCGAEVTAIDSDAIGNESDIEAVSAMIEHAFYSHVSPRAITATVSHLVVDLGTAEGSQLAVPHVAEEVENDDPIVLSGKFHRSEFVNNFRCHETGATLTMSDDTYVALTGRDSSNMEVGLTSIYDEDQNRYVYTGSETA